MGSWFGRRMHAPISVFDPDVIISTYPLGSAGHSWLRSRGRLTMPVGAWIPAFCPDPDGAHYLGERQWSYALRFSSKDTREKLVTHVRIEVSQAPPPTT